MRPVGVVVLHVVHDEVLELASVPDDGAVEELAAQRSDQALGERFDELATTVTPSALASLSRPEWRRNRLRAAWVVHGPVGWW